MEALGYPFDSDDERTIIEQLCVNLSIVQLRNDIILKVIEIRRTKKIMLPDAIIAATVICNNATLVTRNVNDFQSINRDITILNPFKD